MYKNFFGLRENPFSVSPDPRYLFLTPRTREALDELTYGIQTRKGFILLTGEVGTGKTTLINYLLDWLHQQQTPTAFIFNSHLDVSHLFDFMLADFGIPSDSQLKSEVLIRLNRWLLEQYRAGDSPVLIVDEAQGLPLYVLEEIRLLLNLETPQEKLLQIVLSGQPELEEKLNRPELRQLRQRITLRCNTTPLTLEETHGYIQQRLHIAGANGEPVFVSEAMNAVYFYSHGIPRVMNLLCEHALMNAYVDQIRPVPARMVEQVARKFQFDEVKPFAPRSNSGHSTGPNAIAVQSMLANVLIPALAAAEPGLKEQPQAPMTRVSALVAAASSAFNPNKAPAAPVPDRMEISTLNCGPDAPVIIRDPFRRLAVLKPESSPQKCAPRPLVADSTKRIPRRFSRMPILVLYLSLSRWSAKCRDWCLSIVTSPAWPQMTETLLRWSEQPIRAVRSLYRRSFVDSPAGPRMKAFLFQWLQKPFKPMQWREPNTHLFEALRRLSHKKV